MADHAQYLPSRSQFFTFLFFFIALTTVNSQERSVSVFIEVQDSHSGPLKDYEIFLSSGKKKYSILSNEKGFAAVHLSPGEYAIEIRKKVMFNIPERYRLPNLILLSFPLRRM
ncbi:hypothetical protein H3Z85_17440 [Chryseobacterium indologenes]|nr:hypothetical protein H3Z85_17440 [Chryseobacterium indologenes]